MRDLGIADVVPGVEDCYARRYTPTTIQLDPDRCNKVLGTAFSAAFMREILEALGLDVSGDGPFAVTVPTRRADLKAEIDLIEEVGRIAGYDQIPYELPKDDLVGKHSDWQITSDLIRLTLTRCGLNEAVCHSLSDPSLVARFCDVPPVRLRNPVSEEFSVLRPSLVPQLVAAACLSSRHGRRDVALFEAGRVFLPSEGGVEERFSAAGLVVGTLMGGRWNLKPAPLQADFYVCKAVVEALLDAFNVAPVRFEEAQRTGMHPGRTANVVVGGEIAGYLGQIHPSLQEELELPGETYVFELDPDVLRRHGSARSYRPLPRYPAVERDIAVVVDADVPAEAVRQVIQRSGGEVVEAAEVFDVYTGPNLPEGKKSLAFSLTMRSPHGTLTDEQADSVVETVRSALEAELGAVFR